MQRAWSCGLYLSKDKIPVFGTGQLPQREVKQHEYHVCCHIFGCCDWLHNRSRATGKKITAPESRKGGYPFYRGFLRNQDALCFFYFHCMRSFMLCQVLSIANNGKFCTTLIRHKKCFIMFYLARYF